MRASDLFTQYRKSINPPYSKKDILPIFSTLFIILAILLTVFAILNARSYQPRAADQSVRGVSGDLWADVVLGKRNFTEISSGEILPYGVHKAGGVVVDRQASPNRVYVWDGHNSRILGIDLAKCLSQPYACEADIVIGQPQKSDYAACNLDSSFQNYPERAPASAKSLCGMDEATLSTAEILPFVSMYVDSGRLFVPDLRNNRVLVYNNPFGNYPSADQELGQNDFSGNLCNKGNINPSSSSLCFGDPGNRNGAGVALDPDGNLWVADNSNNRVLRFPKDNSNPGKFLASADLVLGQASSFTTGPGSCESNPSAMNKVCNPNSLRFGPGGELYVADGWNQRILVFKPPFTSGMSAYKTFGTNLGIPYIGEVDPSGAGLWVNQTTQGKVVLWDWDGPTIKKTLALPVDSGGGVGIDSEGDVLPAFYYSGGNDVFFYESPLQNPSPNISTPNRYLFSPLSGAQPSNVGSRRLNNPSGVAVAANQLIVTDANRMLYWNNPTSLTSGQPADGVVVQRNFSTTDGNVAVIGVIKADADSRIWVKKRDGINIYQAPLSTGDKPTKVLGTTFNVLGGGTVSLGADPDAVWGITPTSHGEFLWISDSENNRIFRIRGPLTSNPLVDIVLGQKNLSSTSCNQGQTFAGGVDPGKDLLCRPGAISIDKKGNLYVSDHSLETEGNKRLLMFSADTFSTSNTSVLYDPVATKSFPNNSTPSPATFEPAFDSTNRMVVGINPYSGSRFVPFYNDPTSASTTPNGYLKDFYSLPFGATFDKFDNLYITDSNRGRIMIYKDPFNNKPQVAPDTPIPAQTTVITKLSQSSDAAYYSCNLDTTAGEVRIGFDNGWFNCQWDNPKPLTGALRFQNINVPKGAKITNAVISLQAAESSLNPLKLTISGIAAGNVATFSSSNNPINLPKTSTQVPYIINYSWAWLIPDFTPKLTSIVQEVVNRSDWQAGNSIGFIIADNGSTVNRRFLKSLDDLSRSPELTISYDTPGVDTTPPTISITAPTNGSTVSGNVNVTANASDNVGVARVEFYVDSVLKSTDTTSPYGFPWDSTTLANGSHTIDSKAFDTNGNNALATITVTTKTGDTTPPSTPTNLTAKDSAYNKVDLSWTASTDNVGVTGYWIIRGGTTIASSTTNSYSDTPVSPKTTYNYQVVAYDSAGNNSGTSNTTTVTTPDVPDTQAPTAPSSLTASAVSNSQINLSWTASTDDIGVTGYEVYRNSTKVATVTTTSFGDTGLAASTTYSYFVKARDAVGNLSAASNTASATTQAPPSTTGSVTGTVYSSAGGVVSGAKISLTVNGSKKTYVITSSGVYTITNLPAGTYSLKFSATKYVSQTVSVTVTGNTTATKNITLQKR